MKRNVTIFQVCYIFKTNPNFIKAERDLEIAMFMLGCGSELNVGDYQAIHLIHNLVPEPLKEGENYDQDYLDQYHELGKVYFSAIEVQRRIAFQIYITPYNSVFFWPGEV